MLQFSYCVPYDKRSDSFLVAMTCSGGLRNEMVSLKLKQPLNTCLHIVAHVSLRPRISSFDPGKKTKPKVTEFHLQTALWVVVATHIPRHRTPRLRPGVALLEILVIVPHQLTIRFRYNCSLRVRIHRSPAIEVIPRAVH